MSIKIGLIGLGNMGRNHLRTLSILKQAEICFIWDTNHQLMTEMAKEYQVPIYQNLEDALTKVDAVVIAAPTVTHDEYIGLVAKYVQHIFVEKPLTKDYKSTCQLIEFIQKKNKSLNIQVGFIERFNPTVIELKKFLYRTDKPVINVDFARTNKLSERIKDVDVVADLMIHDIDLAIYLQGDAKLIQAYGVMEENMIVFAKAVLRHENGIFSSILASRVTEKKIRQISVTGKDFYVDCNLLRKELLIHKQGVQTYDEIKLTSIEETISVPPTEALLIELLAFLTSIEKQDFSKVPGIEAGIQSIRLVEEISTAIRMQDL